MRSPVILAVALCIVLVGNGARADVPQSLSLNLQIFDVQDPTGCSVPADPGVSLGIRVCDDPQAGQCTSWTSTVSSVPVSNGFASVVIVDPQVINEITGQGELEGAQLLFLEVTICDLPEACGDTPLSLPRVELSSVPYALVAQDADRLAGLDLAELKAQLKADILEEIESCPPDSGLPAGSLMSFFGTEAPPGWLVADGSIIDSTDSPELEPLVSHLRKIGPDFAIQENEHAARLPDLRGVFLRGQNLGRSPSTGNPMPGVDTVGLYQMDGTRKRSYKVTTEGEHTHPISGAGQHKHNIHFTGHTRNDSAPVNPPLLSNNDWDPKYTSYIDKLTDDAGAHSHTAESGGSHSHTVMDPECESGDACAETRPRNVTVLFLIKY